jgi:hypothetical protein
MVFRAKRGNLVLGVLQEAHFYSNNEVAILGPNFYYNEPHKKI